MLESTPPSAVPRRRWPWVVGISLMATMGLGIWSAPALTCAYIRQRCPWLTPAVVIRDARCAGSDLPGMVIARLDRPTFRAIAKGASRRWLPSIVLADGMQAWGSFTLAPEVTWRIQLADRQTTPTITARIPVAVAETLIVRWLGSTRLPLSAIHLTTCTIASVPAGDGLSDWTIQIAFSAAYALGGHLIPLRIDRLNITTRSQLARRPDGRQSLTASARITECVGTIAEMGALKPLRPLLEKELNQRLGQDLPQALVPDWWPNATVIDLSLAPSRVTEL